MSAAEQDATDFLAVTGRGSVSGAAMVARALWLRGPVSVEEPHAQVA